ncbi:MAG: hypothetical protein IH899_22470, partial [Planctomycetes bacterium]|nr:hypothetical protein [Planctomycetota bacterium]
MRFSPIILLLFAMLGCGSGTDPAKTPDPAKTLNAAKTPDAATFKKHMTPAQLALGEPVVNSVGMVMLPIPAGEFQMGSSLSAEEIVKRFHLQDKRQLLLPYL